VLQLAHYWDDTVENTDEANLKALCPGCHLRHDLPLHQWQRKKNREARKRAVQPPLELEE
jgi:hypothetical protein